MARSWYVSECVPADDRHVFLDCYFCPKCGKLNTGIGEKKTMCSKCGCDLWVNGCLLWVGHYEGPLVKDG